MLLVLFNPGADEPTTRNYPQVVPASMRQGGFDELSTRSPPAGRGRYDGAQDIHLPAGPDVVVQHRIAFRQDDDEAIFPGPMDCLHAPPPRYFP